MPQRLAATTPTIDRAARGIMTTDTVAKVAEATVGDGPARVVGIAKGVGMIEPDMATMIAVLLTDADVDPAELDRGFRSAVDRTFNCVSIDTDTSTSDTAVVLASGAAGPVDADAFEAALHDVALALTKQIARDGEGAETLIEVARRRGRDRGAGQARRQGDRQLAAREDRRPRRRPQLGSGGDGGRQVQRRHRHRPRAVVIRFGTQEVYPSRVDDAGLAALSAYLGGDEVLIHVSLGTGEAAATVWGCDLTAGYVRINADYTT